MEDILRRWIGRGQPFSVEQAAAVVKRKHAFTRKRRVYAWLQGNGEPKLSEFLALAEMFGPKFTNEYLETIGQTGVITIKGWMSQEKVNLAAAHYWQVQNEEGNGKDRKIRRALLRLIRRARAHLAGAAA